MKLISIFTCWLLGHQRGGFMEDKWIPLHGGYVVGWRYKCPRCGYLEQNAERGIEFRSFWGRHIAWRISKWRNRRKFKGAYDKNNRWIKL